MQIQRDVAVLIRVFTLVVIGTSSTSLYGQYALIHLGDLGFPDAVASTVNDFSVVAGRGEYGPSADQHAFRWANGTMVDLGVIARTSSSGIDINDRGDIVGRSDTAEPFTSHPVLWPVEGGVVDLGTLGGRDGSAHAINAVGQIVGMAQFDMKLVESRGFLWDAGAMTDLGTLGGRSSDARDINDAGLIVGTARNESAQSRPVLWSNGSITDLGDPGGTQAPAVANAINELGEIVGHYFWIFVNDRAVYWQNGVPLEIHPPNAEWSYAVSINDLSEVLINAVMSGGNDEEAVFVWRDGEFIELSSQLPPNLRLGMSAGSEINNLGQIAGHYNVSFLDQRPVLATPVTPTLSMTRLFPGTAGETNGVRVRGLDPGQRVYLLWGDFGGGTLIPGCDVLDNVSQIENAKLAATGVANGDGVATLSGFMPVLASGRTILFQAIAPDTCSISNLVEQTIE